MVSAAPFRVTVFDKAFRRCGQVARIRELTAIPRHNVVSTAEFVVDADNPRAADMVAKGARAVIDYRDKFLMSGVLYASGAEGPAVRGTRTFSLEGDLRLIFNTLGRQNPTGAITDQAATGQEYYTITGPAETVVKTLIRLNAVERLGRPVIIAPDLGRGATITVSVRMHALADRMLAQVDQAGIGISVRQHPTEAALLVDCYEVGVYRRKLTERSGAVKWWRHATAWPTATRATVQGPGEGLERQYREVIDQAREDDYGDVIEVPRDARDVKADDVNFEAVMAARGAETLAEGAPTAGLEVKFAETAATRYGVGGLNVGTVVDLEVGYGVFMSDVIRAAPITWKTGDGGGVVATPQIGARTDDPNVELAEAIRAVAARTRDLVAMR